MSKLILLAQINCSLGYSCKNAQAKTIKYPAYKIILQIFSSILEIYKQK